MVDERQRSGEHGAGQPGLTPRHDSDRLEELERRLAQMRKPDPALTPGAEKFSQANIAWRMVIELVAGIAVGFGIGYGLDQLLGTMPVMLVTFVLAGFFAGVRTMLRTAAELKTGPQGTGNDMVGDADEDERG